MSYDRRRRVVASDNAVTMLEHLPALPLFERLPVPLLLIDESGRIALANRPMGELVGEAPLALMGRRIATLIPATDAHELGPMAALDKLAGNVIELVNAGGYTVHARVSRSVLLRAEDPFALVAFEDVTERLWQGGH